MILPGIGASGVGAVVASGSGSGGGVGSVSITDQTIIKTGAGLPQKVTYRLNTSGIVEKGLNAAFTTLETWLLTGASAAYDVKINDPAIALTGGSAAEVWLNLAVTRSWEYSAPGGGDPGVYVYTTVSIRQAVSPFTVLDTASITLYANSF